MPIWPFHYSFHPLHLFIIRIKCILALVLSCNDATAQLSLLLSFCLPFYIHILFFLSSFHFDSSQQTFFVMPSALYSLQSFFPLLPYFCCGRHAIFQCAQCSTMMPSGASVTHNPAARLKRARAKARDGRESSLSLSLTHSLSLPDAFWHMQLISSFPRAFSNSISKFVYRVLSSDASAVPSFLVFI